MNALQQSIGCALAAIVCAQALPAWSAPAREAYAPQALDEALKEFATRTRVQLVYTSDLTAGRLSPEVPPDLSMQETLALMLAPSGLTYRFVNERTVAVEPSSASARPGTRVAQTSYATASSPVRLAQAEPTENSSAGNASRDAVAAVKNKGAQAKASPTLLDEIVVTAQRRAENIQDVAVAVSAFSGVQLETLNIQDAQRIADFVPNFKASGLGGAGGPPIFNIRGISFVDFTNLNESSVGVYVDEVYQASQGAGAQQLFDLERVEVLRGPQGTLFGRNTTAGVVHYTTRKPSNEFDANGSIQYGQNDSVILSGAAGGALADGVRLRGAFKLNRDDGWQRNLATGGRTAKTDAIAGRLITQIDLPADFMVELNGHYSRNDGTSAVHRPFWILDPNDPSGYCGGRPVVGTAADLTHAQCVLASRGTSRNGVTRREFEADEVASERNDWPFEYESWGAYVKFAGDLGWGMLTSITSYENYEQLFGYDIESWDNRPLGAGQADWNTHWDSDAEQVSEELRISGEFERNKWVFGAFYYGSEQRALSLAERDGAPTDPIDAAVDTESFALFGQVDAPITETITAALGLRYTDDTRELKQLDCLLAPCVATAEPKISTRAMTGRMAFEWRPVDEQLYYLQYSHGFKSGGFNPVRAATQRGPVKEEEVDSWELGLKRYFLEKTLRLNASVFYYEFTGLQALVGSFDPATQNTVVFYINAGDPRTYGAELEAAWSITDHLEASLGLGLLNTKIVAEPTLTADGRALDGNELPNAPDYSVNAIVRYTFALASAGDLALQVDGRYQDDVLTGVDNDPAEFIDAHGVLNARVAWTSPGGRWTVEGFVDNVLDENVLQHVFHSSPSSFPVDPRTTPPAFDSGFGVWGRPRLWGVKFSVDY